MFAWGAGMSERLNGWQRVGIVLSVVWVIGAAIHEKDELNRQYEAAYDAAWRPVYDQCSEAQKRDPQTARGMDCLREAQRIAWATTPKVSGWSMALAALVPIPIAWLLVYALIALVRWIRRGFSPS
jgi:hypothetical protein